MRRLGATVLSILLIGLGAAAAADGDGDGVDDADDNCPTWFNPDQDNVLFGSTIEAQNRFEFTWPAAVDWELATGTFTSPATVGSYATDFYESGSGDFFAEDPSTLEPGTGWWYLWRPHCAAGSYSTGTLSQEGNRDAALIP